MLRIRNPHTALQTIRHRPEAVEKILLSHSPGEAWQQVAKSASKAGIKVQSLNRPDEPSAQKHKKKKKVTTPDLERDRDISGGRVSRSEAWIKPKSPVLIDQLFQMPDPSEFTEGGHGIWLALDQIQDPQNLGAIFRTAAFFGIRGIIMPRERSAPLSETVYDVSSGGIEIVPFSIIPNLQHAFALAKEKGLWIIGTSEHAQESLYDYGADRPWLLVMGNEERGMRRLTAESCDVICSIPSRSEVGSLNVSVATGIMISWLAKPSSGTS